MALYRVKQFIWSVGSYFKKVDDNYINKFLDKNEQKLFDKLKHNDKQHCIRVCKDAIKISEKKGISVDKKKLGKAALLHDIGKSEYSLNVIEKSALVLLHSMTKGKIKRYSGIKHIDIYYNHGQKGADMLKTLNRYDKEFLDSVRYHHNNKHISKRNDILEIIRESDNQN